MCFITQASVRGWACVTGIFLTLVEPAVESRTVQRMGEVFIKLLFRFVEIQKLYTEVTITVLFAL